MKGDGAIIALLFCGVDDDMKDTLSEALMLGAAAAALQDEAPQTKLLISQPLPAEGGKGVQLQVDSETSCRPEGLSKFRQPWTAKF